MARPKDSAARKEPAAQGYALLAILIAAAAASWVWLADYDTSNGEMVMTATMGLSALPFLSIWAVMMVAMMFPTAAPMILTFQKIQSRRAVGSAFFATTVFVVGYLLIWALTGVGAYVLARNAEAVASYYGITSGTEARVAGAIFCLAGLYQLTTFKNVCLTACRSPIDFIMTFWRAGTTGAFLMGSRHGLYCFGCCWLFFVILFPLGMMNILAMAAITLLIFAEKVLPWGQWGARATAAGLIAYGGVVIAFPCALPTYFVHPQMNMNMPTSD
jgi:predicted metal-binding membrane protein